MLIEESLVMGALIVMELNVSYPVTDGLLSLLNTDWGTGPAFNLEMGV